MPQDSNTIIAIVEDEDDLRINTELFLRSRGYQAWGVESAEALYRQLHTSQADVILVDINLPGEDGFSLIERLAALERYGLIAMTARETRDDRIKGLNCGADMYFVKPVDLYELEAGIRSVLRRREAASRPIEDEAVAWRLDYRESILHSPDGGSIKLTSRELELLFHLMSNAGQTLEKKEMYALLENQATDDLHRIDSLVYRLRKKAEVDMGHGLPIRAVFGRGLVFAGAAVIKNRPIFS